MTYTVSDYGSMIDAGPRVNAYVKALQQAVTADSVVLEIGTGTGFFALLACQLGARRVFAIEPEDVIAVAAKTAAANGYAGRIDFIQDLSTRVTLPERATVLISDLRGVLPLFGRHIPAIVDARRRLLAPDAVIIPRRDEMWAAVVTAADVYEGLVGPFGAPHHGLDLSASLPFVVNHLGRARFGSEQILLEPRRWASLDYESVEDADACAELRWVATRRGVGHGLAVWFETLLTSGVALSSAPSAPRSIYKHAFFPWEAPVELEPGDTVAVLLRADLVGEDYVWAWNSRVLRQGREGEVKAHFTQSTLRGTPLSPARLRKRAEGYRPRLDEPGEIDRFILSLMDGQTSQGDIARQALQRFPARFVSWHAALTHVGDLSLRYSKD